MSPEEAASDSQRAFEFYKLVVQDEHHLRDLLQRRITFQTSVMLGSVAGIVAITAADLDLFSGIIAALLGALVVLLGELAKAGPTRIYEHFIDTIDAREHLEVHLGIRAPDAGTRTPTRHGFDARRDNLRWWRHGHVFVNSWARRPTDGSAGYLKRTRRLMGTLQLVGGVVCLSYGIYIVHELWVLVQ